MAKKKEQKTEKITSVFDVARLWLSKESNLYMNMVEEYGKLEKAGRKKNAGRLAKLDTEKERLVDEYVADAERMMHTWLGMTDDEYQMWLRNLATLGEKLNADAMDDLESIVADIKQVKVKMVERVEVEILKGPAHVDKCLAAVEHKEAMDRVKNEIADLTVLQNRAKKTAKELGKTITEKSDKLEEMEFSGSSPGVLFDHADKEEQKKKQIESALENCPECDGTGIYEGDIECEKCDGIGRVKAENKSDNLFDAAARLVIVTPSRSVSALQRQLNIGHAHASKLKNQLIEVGILSPSSDKVLMTLDQYEKRVNMVKTEMLAKDKQKEKQIESNKYIFNEHGVCTNPDVIVIKFPKHRKVKVELRYAQGPDGKWYYGRDVLTRSEGNSDAPSCGPKRQGYDTKEEAIDQAATEVKEWLTKKKPAGLDAIIATIDKQVESAISADKKKKGGETPAVELHVFTNDVEWIIAKDMDDCALIAGDCGWDDDYMDSFRCCADEEELVFTPEGGEPITKTAKEWCKERGRGLFMTTEA